MKIKQILADVARLLLKGELADNLENNSSLSDEEKVDVKYLLHGYNIIQHEVASEYLSLLAEERKFGKEIAFADLSYFPIKIVSVCDDDGEKVPFTVREDKIKLDKDNWHTVRYRHAPNKKEQNDDFDYENTKIGKRAFIYGTASEYCLMTGRYEDAANWRNKFEKAATSPLTRGKTKIKGRIWG